MEREARNCTVDLLRTLAIALMVVFHFLFHLKSFGYTDWDIPDGAEWNAIRNLIVGLFVGCVGISLSFAYRGGVRPRHAALRFLKIAACAAAVTAMSLLSFPGEWIYFGVLHFIALASVLSLPLVRRPALALLLGGAMVLAYWAGVPPYGWPFGTIGHLLPDYTRDFVSPSPWLGVVWLGIAVGYSPWLRRDPLADWRHARRLGGPGRHSLAIYVVHLPLLFVVFWSIDRL